MEYHFNDAVNIEYYDETNDIKMNEYTSGMQKVVNNKMSPFLSTFESVVKQITLEIGKDEK